MTSKRNKPKGTTHEVLHATLIGLSLDRDASEDMDPQDVEGFSYTYGAVASVLGEDEGLALVRCDFNATQQFRETIVFDFSATYAVGVKSSNGLSEEKIRLVMTEVVGREVWARFRDLYAFARAQANFDTTPLPFLAEVDWKTAEEIAELQGSDVLPQE